MSIEAALALLIQLISQADAIGRLIQTARGEGRDITDAELDQLALADDAARQALQDAIARARAADQ